MFRKWFLNLVLLTGICSTSLFSIDRKICCSNCVGSGFLIGGYGTFHLFEFHTQDSTVDDGDEEGLWEYDAMQRAPGGGGFVGYGIPFCEWFNLAFKAAVTGFASDARHSYDDNTPQYSYTNNMRLKYIADLSLEPGTKIGNYLLLYVKFGASVAGLRQTRQIVERDIPHEILGEDIQHYHNWGYVFGSGASTTIIRCISAFAEYDWHSYPINISTRRINNTDDSDSPLDYRLTRLHGYGFTFGLMAQF